MYKRILVAVDDTKTSRHAFDIALDLARPRQATLRAFHAIKDSAFGYQVPSYDPSVLREKLTEEGADVVVMSTHGRRGVHRLLMGSVAERCVPQSALPVLLVPSAACHA
jgi:nucleotide-binding universal stress UspA family protein